ncbi:hypothetical protein [Plantactinospora soyae]|uniref:Secreted protein n=1 Tax=Plantactinospora soyae TaxID=1544732 RepID=A0A927MD35_9ACTN|nr:hypothetical protein [Plantactinospora soyae]MBE1489533.1 hypothetical protein [Plantactinospora soyae]
MRQPSTSRSRQRRGAVRVAAAMLLAGALATTGAPPANAGQSTTSHAGRTADRCVSIRPETGFYAGGRIGSEELTTPNSSCTTISVSHVQDPANPTDRCQTFLLGFWPLVDGSLVYTEPVTACGRHRTVLARNVPNNAQYIVIYAIDYIDPVMQTVEFRVWH